MRHTAWEGAIFPGVAELTKKAGRGENATMSGPRIWLSTVIFFPVFAFLILFALYPALGMALSSFVDGNHLTLNNYAGALAGQYLSSFIQTGLLSIESGLIGVVGGAFVAWSLSRIQIGWVSRTLGAIASVMANFAGLPLAVAFMATMGTSGFVTLFFQTISGKSLMDMGFNLASESGLIVVYATFLVPLAVILLSPAVHSIRYEWEEAAYTLGGSTWTYVRSVVIPILLPSLVGTFALLFANAFSSYVTAYAIAGGTVNLIPLQIGYLINGNVSMNLGLGDALAMLEIIVLGVSVAVFLLMQKRGTKWQGGSSRG